MTEIYTTVSLGLIAAWFIALPFRPILGPAKAVPLGVAIGVLVAVFLRQSMPVLVAVSLLEPMSFGLTALAICSFLRPFMPMLRVAVWEQLALLGGLCVFYASSAGMLSVDLYRHGYDPLTVGGIAVVLSLYAALRGYLFLALVPVVAQLLWLSGIASSNYFDHLLHATMICILPISILVGFLRPLTGRREKL
jgi:hypothetical protein